MVVLVSPGDEMGDWLQYEAMLMLEACWNKPDARVVVVAPAVGAIPTALRHQPFVSYYPHSDVRPETWAQSGVPSDFLDALLTTSPRLRPTPSLSDAEARQWRNRLVHLGQSHPGLEQEELEQLRRYLARDLDMLAPLMARAAAENVAFTSEDVRSLLDRVYLAQTLGDATLLDSYYRLVIETWRRGVRDAREGGTLDYNIGLVARALGEQQMARDLFARASETADAAFGNTHPAAIAARFNLGLTLFDLGERDQAAKTYELALRTSIAALGPFHPQTAAIAYSFGQLAAAQGDIQRARTLLELASEAYERVTPEESTVRQAVASALTRLRLTEG